MKSVFIVIVLLQSMIVMLKAEDSHFRFYYIEGATTNYPDSVVDEKGERTTVKLSKDSDPGSVAILSALINQRGIWGSAAPKKDPRGITWDQGIILIGSFVSEPIQPPTIPDGAADGPYRAFKISKINIELPFARWVETDKKDPVDTPYVVEFHLELRSLIPEGIFIDGRALDLRNYEAKSKSEQGGADQATTAPESKPKNDEKPKPESEGRFQ